MKGLKPLIATGALVYTFVQVQWKWLQQLVHISTEGQCLKKMAIEQWHSMGQLWELRIWVWVHRLWVRTVEGGHH